MLERGYPPALEFIAEFPELGFVHMRFIECQIVIVIRGIDGVLNAMGCARHDIIGAIRFGVECLGSLDSRWGVLCSPPVALVAMTELLGDAYRFLEAA